MTTTIVIVRDGRIDSLAMCLGNTREVLTRLRLEAMGLSETVLQVLQPNANAQDIVEAMYYNTARLTGTLVETADKLNAHILSLMEEV
jgi:hypothetical protein